ncbi:MAG: transglutaminase-like cysteine peptidase [Bauldia sp.]|nr:transglutaminase-like cysteine peptidase [Bauldia sp.]
MSNLGALKAVLVATILVATSAIASAAGSPRPMNMAVGGKTSQPIGHHEFCVAHPAECSVHSETRVHVRLDRARWKELTDVNQSVNTGIRPATDEEMYGRPEVWGFPTTSGDCEDYALLKRKRLLDKGWPAAALLITVVRQTNGDGHAVLTVTTDHGDLVLDNLDSQVRLWSATSYRYLKRQSEYDSGAWVAIEDGRGQQPLVGSLR